MVALVQASDALDATMNWFRSEYLQFGDSAERYHDVSQYVSYAVERRVTPSTPRALLRYDAKDDSRMVKSMRAGRTMIMEGTSGRGTKTRDTYSLSGFSAAHNAINKACKPK